MVQYFGIGPAGLRASFLFGLTLVLLPLVMSCGARGHTFGFQRDALRSQRLAEAYAPYRQPGASVVSGNISLVNDKGQLVVARNLSVRLMPATTFSRMEFAAATAEGRMPLTDLDEKGVVIWTGRTDIDGNFQFEGLPAGEYFVLCHVSWIGEIEGKPAEKTGLVGGEIALGYAEHRRLVLSPDYSEHAPEL
jgi:hypothetical protein